MPSAREDPRTTRSRELALDAARRVFLEAGYDGATLDQVAAEAGLAKRTLYNLYADKNALFRATILRAIAIVDEFTSSLSLDVRAVHDPDALPALGVRLAEATLLGPALTLRRLLIRESGRFADLVAEYRDRVPEAVMDSLAQVFAAMIAQGLLRKADPRIAAEHFAFLVMGADLDRGTFTGESPTVERTRARARLGGEAFLRAYAAPT